MASALATRQTALTARVAGKAPRCSVRAMAAARPLWLPGGKVPSHLKGELAGDYGFDPLNLASNPDALTWFQHAELINGRTAMTGVAGILIPAILTKAGVLNVPDWTVAGEVAIQNGNIPFNALLMVQLFLCGFVESKRWMDILKPGSQAEAGSFLGFESSFKPKAPGYPGGPFDPLGLSNESPEKFKDLQLKEIKNARLAMLAFLGFVAQHAATGKGPIDNLLDHLASPWTTTFIDNGVSVPGF